MPRGSTPSDAALRRREPPTARRVFADKPVLDALDERGAATMTLVTRLRTRAGALISAPDTMKMTGRLVFTVDGTSINGRAIPPLGEGELHAYLFRALAHAWFVRRPAEHALSPRKGAPEARERSSH